jgi:hypothetical protein
MNDELETDSFEEIPTPTITNADRMAAGVMELLEAIAARIPGLESPHPSSSGVVRGGRTVSRETIIGMIGLVENFPELQRTFDVEAAHEMLQFNAAVRPVVLAMAGLMASLSYTMEVKKARVVSSMMQTYSIAKVLARQPDHAGLYTRLEILGREISRGPRRKRQSSPPAE